MDSKQVEEHLMRLIVLSGKAMASAIQALEGYLSGALSRDDFDRQWQNAKEREIEAHTVQTQLIEWDLKGDGAQTTLLAVHAQDHFMNSHLVIQLGDMFIQQQEYLKKLETRLREIEGSR